MSDQWSASPGSRPPAGRSAPPGWGSGPTAVYEPPTFGSGPPLPPLPPPVDRSRDRVLALVAVALVILVLLAMGGIFYLGRSTGDAPVAAGPGASSTTATTSPRSSTTSSIPGRSSTTRPAPGQTTVPRPTTTISPSLLPTQDEVEAMVRELSAFVASARGLDFKTPVRVQMVSDDDFNKRLLQDLDKNKAELEKQGHAFKALGLIDSKVDMVELSRALLQAGVLGFYDPETKELVIRGQEITPFTKQVVAHELVHALDDQWFELNRPQYDDQKDEIGFGFSAVVEGNARRIENIYVGRMTPEDKSRRDAEEAAFTSNADLSGVPEILLKLAQAPYDFGQAFVRKLMDRGGNDTLARALTDPPRMSASVMHPDRYFAGDVRVEVAKPASEGKGGKEFDDGVFGELMTRATLEAALATTDSAKAADGWAGDWYVTWEGENKSSCIRIDYKMLTALDLADLKNAFTKWGSGRPGVKVQSVGDDMLEVTSCTTGGGSGGRSPA